jgi:uncharacterized protein (DUF58 family)
LMQGSFRRTQRGTTVLILAASLVTLGLLLPSQSTEILPLVGVGLFLYYFVSKHVLELKVRALGRLRVSREHRRRVPEDREVEISVILVNETFVSLTLEMFDSYPDLFRLRGGSNAAVVRVPAKGYARVRYTIAPTSVGRHEFSPIEPRRDGRGRGEGACAWKDKGKNTILRTL